jgi:hypothetical protein
MAKTSDSEQLDRLVETNQNILRLLANQGSYDHRPVMFAPRRETKPIEQTVEIKVVVPTVKFPEPPVKPNLKRPPAGYKKNPLPSGPADDSYGELLNAIAADERAAVDQVHNTHFTIGLIVIAVAIVLVLINA